MFQLAHHCKNDVWNFHSKYNIVENVSCLRDICHNMQSVTHLRENHASFFTVYSLTLKSLEVQYIYWYRL